MIVEEKKKPNNYFNEEQVTKWIFDYQKSAVIETNEEGVDVVVWKDKKLEELISLEIMKIVKAIIQVYRYYIFEPYDDCLQHGMMSCYTNYMKWKPEKGTAFNFFSIISKRSLLNYTERRQKHRNHSDIEEMIELHGKEFDFDTFIEEMKDVLFGIINENYTGKKRKNFIQISVILSDYLMKTKKFVSKTDFYSWARSYGMRSIDIREFVKEMSSHGCELFEGMKNNG
jgi:DNA-directed RNA polymerase specialized sigma subunit